MIIQEIIKVRERILIKILTQGNPFKLLLDIVPNSHGLRGCFRGGSVYVVSFRFKNGKPPSYFGDVFFDILLRLSITCEL